jgi:hypothetical protein
VPPRRITCNSNPPPTSVLNCYLVAIQISVNAWAVSEPASALLLKYSTFRNHAAEFCSSRCLWPVGTEVAAGGRSRQQISYTLALSPSPQTTSRGQAPPSRFPNALATNIQETVYCSMDLKPLAFVGKALEDLRAFPGDARRRAGFELDQVQRGLRPTDWKPMTSIGSGVLEVRIHAGVEHRVF